MNESYLHFKNFVVGLALSVLSIGMLFFLGLYFFWLYYDYDIIRFNISHYEMQKEEYKVGEPLTFRTSFCKKGDYEAKIIYQIEDGVTYLMPIVMSKSNEGCKDFISSTLRTPNIPSGEYRIKGVITYKVNPIREVSYVMYSNKFRIVNE